MEATHKISAVYWPKLGEISLTWENLNRGQFAHLDTNVTSDEGEAIASVVMPCVYQGATTLDPKVYETIILKKLTDTQTQLAKAVELLLECKPLIEENEDDFTSTAPDIRAFIKEYAKTPKLRLQQNSKDCR